MSTHPTAEQIERYRNRSATAHELISVDAHIAECDRCHAAVRVDAEHEIAAVIPPAGESDHLTYEEMEQAVDGRIDDLDREILEGHLASCRRCRDELAALTRDSEGLRASIDAVRALRTKRRLLAAAGLLIAVAGGGTWALLRDDARRPPVVTPTAAQTSHPAESSPTSTAADPLRAHLEDVRRGKALARPDVVAVLVPQTDPLRGDSRAAAFSLIEPMGTLVRDELPVFRWRPARGASSYKIAVIDAETGDLAASGVTETNSWQPLYALPRGRTYSWQVTANVDGRALTEPQPPAAEALFVVAAGSDVEQTDVWRGSLENDPLALGILLAERGFLDEAELALQEAMRGGDPRGGEILEQVRSWRRPLRS
jgi:anti-sigma factor RsiW